MDSGRLARLAGAGDRVLPLSMLNVLRSNAQNLSCRNGFAASLDPKITMAAAQTVKSAKKVCFVTIGATASFNALLEAVLTPTFLETLEAFGYTDLLLQHGKEGSSILENLKESEEYNPVARSEINISGFDFNKQGLGQEMRAAKGENGDSEGVVISHAGTTTVNLLVVFLCRLCLRFI